MSTDSPLPTAPAAAAELPTTSQNGENIMLHNSAYLAFDESNIGDNMTVRKRNIATVDDTNDATAAGSTSSFNKNVSEATSSTAYAFAGSALGTEKMTTTTPASYFSTATTTTTTAGTNSSAGTNANDNANNTNSNNNEDKQEDSLYECNICLDTAKDAVVSMCGHLFCWPCLHQWLETRPNRMLCPVCKAAISKDKVIPLYGRNSSKQEDPRNKVPPRPAGQRTEPEPQQGFQGFGFGDGFHMSFGIGAFPFGYFASSFNIGEPRPAPANRGTMQYEDEQSLSKMFLYLAFLFIAWLMFA